MQAALATFLAPLMLSTSLLGGLAPGNLSSTTEYKSAVDIAFGCPAPWCPKSK